MCSVESGVVHTLMDNLACLEDVVVRRTEFVRRGVRVCHVLFCGLRVWPSSFLSFAGIFLLMLEKRELAG